MDGAVDAVLLLLVVQYLERVGSFLSCKISEGFALVPAVLLKLLPCLLVDPFWRLPFLFCLFFYLPAYFFLVMGVMGDRVEGVTGVTGEGVMGDRVEDI